MTGSGISSTTTGSGAATGSGNRDRAGRLSAGDCVKLIPEEAV